MSKHEEFTTFIDAFKAVSPTITDEQRIGLLRQAKQQYSLTIDEATEILKAADLVVDEGVNYFEVLGLSIAEIQSQNEADVATRIEAAHEERYSASLRAGARVRPDGRTEEQWRHVLNQARDTLKDAEKRRAYIATRLSEEEASETPADTVPLPESGFQKQESTPTSSIAAASVSIGQNTDAISRLSNDDAPTDMVLIPAGEFLMGNSDEKTNDNEKPAHTVYVDACYMDKYLVTNEQYKTFLEANPQWRKPQLFKDYISTDYHDGAYLGGWDKTDYPTGEGEHPVTKVGWYAAMAYAQWIGKRLPTEAEWEKAARGGLEEKKYPWGNSVDFSKANYFFNVGGTAPVGRYPANGYGLYDMSGNAWEWCLDAYDADFYAISPPRNPLAGANTMEEVINNFRSVQSSRVLRGGSWLMDSHGVRVAYRFRGSPTDTYSVFGFRCVKPAPP